MPRPQSLRHLSGSIPALGMDGVHGPRGHFSPGRRVWWNYARLFIPMLVGQAAVVGHEQPAIPGLTQIEARPAVRAATEVCRPVAAPSRDPRVDAISERSGQIHVYVHARCLGRASPLFAGSMVSEAA
jgi:hypothetical protein